MEPKPLSLERRKEIQDRLQVATGPHTWRDLWSNYYASDVGNLLREVERLEEEVRQARGNRQ